MTVSPTHVIVNLGGENYQTDALRQSIINRSGDKRTEVIILNLKGKDLSKPATEEERELFRRIDSTTKIYILDHGIANSKYISSGDYETLGDYFGARLDKAKVNDPHRKLRFSFLSCHASTGGC